MGHQTGQVQHKFHSCSTYIQYTLSKLKIKHMNYPFFHHRHMRMQQNTRKTIPAMQNITIPSGKPEIHHPSPAAMLPNKHANTISPASLIFLAVILQIRQLTLLVFSDLWCIISTYYE